LKRDFGVLIGRYKLDWFFVKPCIPRPQGEGLSYRFAPISRLRCVISTMPFPMASRITPPLQWTCLSRIPHR
jgi:hypothetical protein